MHRFASTQIKILTMNIYLNKHQIWKWYWIEVNNLSALLTFMKLFLRNMYICICFRTTSNRIHGVKLEIRKVSTHIFPCKVILKNNQECDRNLVLYTLVLEPLLVKKWNLVPHTSDDIECPYLCRYVSPLYTSLFAVLLYNLCNFLVISSNFSSWFFILVPSFTYKQVLLLYGIDH